MKQNDGKGSIRLILAVAMVIVAVVFGVKYIKDFFNKESTKDLQADMLLMQNKVEIVQGNYSMDKEAHPLKGYQLTQLPEEIDINEFLSKNVIPQEEYEKYYVLDKR